MEAPNPISNTLPSQSKILDQSLSSKMLSSPLKHAHRMTRRVKAKKNNCNFFIGANNSQQVIRKQESRKNFYNKTKYQRQMIYENSANQVIGKNKNRQLTQQKAQFQFGPKKHDDLLMDEYSIIFKPPKIQTKSQKQLNWVEKFIEPKSLQTTVNTINQDDDSIEIICGHVPGPQTYHPSFDKQTSINPTFSKAQRFTVQRPNTTNVQYLPNKTISKDYNNKMEHIAFGTSLSNLRSQIKRIQYCEWLRSHCCANSKGMAQISKQNAKRIDPSFASSSKRFVTKPSYSNKDYYQNDSHKNKENQLPNYYFMESNKREDQSDEDQRDFHGQEIDTIQKHRFKLKCMSMTRKLPMKKQNLNHKEREQKKDGIFIYNTPSKNEIGNKKRKPIIKKSYPFHQQPQKLECSPTQTRKLTNQWITPSFNIKFQSTSKLL